MEHRFKVTAINFLIQFYQNMKVVCANTQRTLRMVMNAIYSYLFNVEISDQPILAKNSKKGLTYGELRILSFLRNPLFNIEEFQKREIRIIILKVLLKLGLNVMIGPV